MDARGQRLGRLAAEAARVLQGKHRAIYSPHELTGDFVVVVNAAAVDVTGNKRAQKVYYRHTGYVGHLRTRTLDEMMTRFPERVIQAAVKGMLPRNRLGRRMLKRLKVYAGAEHPHEAQVNAGTGARAAARAAAERRRAEAAAAPPPAVEQVEEQPQAAPPPEPAAEQADEQPQSDSAPAAEQPDEQPQADPAHDAAAEQTDEQPQAESAPDAVAEQADEQPQGEPSLADKDAAPQPDEPPQAAPAPPRRRRATTRKAAPKKDEQPQADLAPDAAAEQAGEQSQAAAPPRRRATTRKAAPKKDKE